MSFHDGFKIKLQYVLSSADSWKILIETYRKLTRIHIAGMLSLLLSLLLLLFMLFQYMLHGYELCSSCRARFIAISGSNQPPSRTRPKCTVL